MVPTPAPISPCGVLGQVGSDVVTCAINAVNATFTTLSLTSFIPVAFIFTIAGLLFFLFVRGITGHSDEDDE